MVAKPAKKLLFLLTFICLAVFSTSVDVVKISYKNGFSQSYSATDMKTFQISFSSSNIPTYVHAKVTSDSSTLNQIVYYSNSDQTCKENRILMARRPGGKPVDLFLTQNQAYSSKPVYVCVQCQERGSCSFNLELTGEEMAELSIPGTYTYYVANEDTEEMTFSFSSRASFRSSVGPEESSYISLWAKGNSNSIETTFDEKNAFKHSFGYGDIYTLELIDTNSDIYELKVKANVGELVTVGANMIEKGISSIELDPNEDEIVGHLKKGAHDIECYFLPKKDYYKQYGEGSILYISGISFSRVIYSYYMDSEMETIPYTGKVIRDGSIYDGVYVSELADDGFFCLSIPDLDDYYLDEVSYTLSLSDNTKNGEIYNPQLMGVIYPRYLSKDEVGLFSAVKASEGSKAITYDMFSIYGFPDMLYDECETYPLCTYDEEKLKSLINPRHVNRMTSYTKYLSEEDKEKITPISAHQPLLVVKCTDGRGRNNDESARESTNLCHFTTVMYSDKETLTLREAESYTQYILENDVDKYKVVYEGITGVKKVYLDLLVFSGDVSFELDSKIEVHKYFLANKIFYSITVDESRTIKEIEFSVRATRNSFYFIEYQLVQETDQSIITNILEPGVSFLESVDPKTEDKSKIIKISNKKRLEGFPFMANFYSLNCKFTLKRIAQDEEGEKFEKDIEVVDKYGQEIISNSDPDFYSEYYEYRIHIIEEDISIYSTKLCMVYASSLSLEDTSTGLEGTLSIAEGVPQNFIFKTGYNRMRYTYYIADQQRNAVANFNLIDKAPYKIDIYYGYSKGETYEISRNSQIHLVKGQWAEYCKEGEICSVTFDIQLDVENMRPGLEPRLETTIRQIEGPPVYLEKNVLKLDITAGNSIKYYYVDIGKEEMGDVTINYRRGSGKVFGKIVKKSQTIADEGADWRGMYRFPEEKDDSIRYEGYLKKLVFSPDQTEDCDEGCYLLLSVHSSVVGEASGEYRFYPFSILVRVSPGQREYEDVPKVTMLINEYVIGNVATSQHERMYEFYQVFLPYDADEVIIDWQSDRPSLFINVGDTRPTTTDAHFKFPSIGHDTIFRLTKNEILSVCKSQGINVPFEGSIKNIQLVLGIWTDQVDTVYTSVYAMKLHLAFKNQIDVYHVRTDQKVLCETTSVDGNDEEFRCLYAIVLDGLDIIGNITALPKLQDDGASYKIYADYVESKYIDDSDYDYLAEHIPVAKTAQFNTDKTGYPFLYVTDQKYGYYLFISVVTNKKTVVELMSSIDLDDRQIAPNPSTAQLFSIQEKTFYFQFATSEDLLINIVSVNGKAEIYWELEPDVIFYLQGKDDRLTMTSGTSKTEQRYSRLIVESKTDLEGDIDPGFVFYVTYYPRSQIYNIDQLKVGKSVEFNYRDADFPINFFVKLNDMDKDISATLNFFHLADSESRDRFFNGGQMLSIWAKVISSKEAYIIRTNDEERPKKDETSVLGVYNGALNVANVFLSSNKLKSFGVSKEDEPYLFFTVEKSDEVKFVFTRISTEVTVLQQGAMLPATEKVYQYGKLAKNEEYNTFYNTYRLTTNKLKPYMRVEFAANSGYFDWSVSTEENSRTNDTFSELTTVYSNGRSLMTFKVPKGKEIIYLNVFLREEGAEVEPQLGNYAFKYMNGPNPESFFDYKVADDHLVITKVPSETSGNNWTISFYAVPGSENYQMSYFMRGVSKASYIPYESIDTIAFTESQGFTLQIDNPKVDKDGKITIIAYEILMNPRYITILAKIKDRTVNEFILYQPEIYWDTPDSHPGTEELVVIDYDYERDYTSYIVGDAFKKQKYQINFAKEPPKYVKIESITDEENPNQILYFSPTDPLGVENRQQLSQEGAERTVTMWLKKEQFENKKLYVAVECQNTRGSCDYELRITPYDYIEEDINFIYTYYVSENNKEMVFHINKEFFMSGNGIGDSHVTIYGKGSKDIDIKVTGINAEKFKYRNGVAMTFVPPNDDSEESYYELKVTGKVGDYISVGSKLITNGRSGGNLLQPNSAEVFGYLIKGELEEECYSITDLNSKGYEEVEMIYITGIFYNRIGQVYLRDTDYEPIPDSDTLVEKGSYFYKFDVSGETKKDIYVCVKFPTVKDRFSIDTIPYTLQITEPVHHIGLLNIYAPQANGIIYPRLLPKDSIVYFSGIKTLEDAKKISYNMLGLTGFPKMYIHKCKTYPNCRYSDDFLDENEEVIKPHNVNRMSTWVTDAKNTSPISPEQYVIVVKCLDGNTVSSEFCSFETSIFSNKDEVLLLPEEPFSQYILAKEKHSFYFDFDFEKGLEKVFIDTFIMSGDVTFNLRKNADGSEIDYHKYYLANKIFFSITLNKNPGLKKIYMDIEAPVNSYYSIEYKLVTTLSPDYLTNFIDSGINYLVPIDPTTQTRSKTIQFTNLRVGDENPFLTNFYSLNCDFNIERSEKIESETTRKTINLYDNYAQEVFTKDERDYKKGTYDYLITITNEDKSNYDHKMCMLYVTGIELTNPGSFLEREIIVSEGITQRVIFEKGVKKIRYLYPHPDQSKDLFLNFNLNDIAKYKVNVYYEYKLANTIELSRSKNMYLSASEWSEVCSENQLCNIIVEIELLNTIIEEMPLLEFFIRPIENIPTYIPKGIYKKDFVVNDNGLYLFTDIGETEQAEVIVDFLRGSGRIFGKIAKKTQVTPDENPNWRQLYHIPNTDEDSLYYDPYLKKLYVTPPDTEGCKEGCYLLLFINSTVSGKMDLDFRSFQFSIKISVTPAERIYTDIPKIKLQADEHVVGNVAKATSERIYEFYEIWLPYDAERVEFDWQSDVAGLYVNVGDERPTKENADFKLGSTGSDTIMQISKGDLLQKAKNKLIDIPYQNSLKNIQLVIGIWTDKTDSVSTTVYSLKVHLPLKKEGQKEIDIFKVNSDQKSLCRPTKVKDNEYRCLYIVLYDELDYISNLILYADSHSKSANTYMYASPIDNEIYETYDIEKLTASIPNYDNAKYNNKKDNVNYLFVDDVEGIKNHLFVSVVSDNEEVIELMSSFYTFDKIITPNPSTPQLFSVVGEELVFDFASHEDILINIVGLAGEAEIYWEKESERIYNLRGKDDRLTLTSGTDFMERQSSKLIIKNRRKQTSLRRVTEEGTYTEMSNPGFCFYVSYYLRTPTFNFDEIYGGKSLEMAYRDTDLPVFLYSKILDSDHDVNVALSFRDVEYKNETMIPKVLNKNRFSINGAIIKEVSVYATKLNPDLRPSLAQSNVGVYDAAIKTAQVFFSKEDLKRYGIAIADKPTLYFGIDKSEYGENIHYTRFSFDVSIIKENDRVPVTEKIYQYGKLGSGTVKNSYILRNNRKNDYMRIQFSANSKAVDFAINLDEEGKTTNSTLEDMKVKTYGGKLIVTFKTPNDKEYFYLTVFVPDKKDLRELAKNQKLTNYVFKYINSPSVDLLKEYPIVKNNNKINLIKTNENKKEGTMDIKVTINPIDYKADVTYSVRIVPGETVIKGELSDTIAITESPNVVVRSRNPNPNKDGTITIEGKGVPLQYTHFQIIAQVLDETITEYVAYNSIYVEYKGDNKTKGSSVPVWVLILSGGILVIIVIALVIVLLKCKEKNQDLMYKVNQISFKQSMGDGGDTNLLLNDNDAGNALD